MYKYFCSSGEDPYRWRLTSSQCSQVTPMTAVTSQTISQPSNTLMPPSPQANRGLGKEKPKQVQLCSTIVLSLSLIPEPHGRKNKKFRKMPH